jgi:Family of unknown function (DUF5681)
MIRATDIGYRKPPAATRFQKGRSGNPNGRLKGRHHQPPYDVVLGQMVAIKEDGVERRVTAAEAFLLYMTKRGLEGDGAAARSAMAAIEEARSARYANAGAYPKRIEITFVSPGSVDPALLRLRMASKLDRFRPSARILLEPWLVQEALSRLGDRRLSPDEQAKVVRATRTPHKVRWPEWWEVKS